MPSEKLTLSPEEFYFKAPYTRTSTIELCLENKTNDQHVAYKVKTIDPKRYIVKPTNGFISPGKSAIVKVTMQALPSQAAIEAFLATKQKFMVQWRTLTTAPEANESPLKLMAKSEGDPMVENKVICRFDQPSEQSASYKSVDGVGQGATSHAEGIDTDISSNHQAATGQDGQAFVAPTATVAAPTNSGCPLGCFRYLLALVALLIALYVAYVKYGYKLQGKGKQ